MYENIPVNGEWAELDDGIMVKKTPVTKLPGWHWEDFSDGSGGLKAPNGKSYFSYDRMPYSRSGEVEYIDDLRRLMSPDPEYPYGWHYTKFGGKVDPDMPMQQKCDEAFRQFKQAMEKNVLDHIDIFKGDIEKSQTFVVEIEGRSVVAYNNIRGNKLSPGDMYVAKRNTGWHLAKCLYVDHDDGWVMPDPPGSIYSYDCHECFKVKSIK